MATWTHGTAGDVSCADYVRSLDLDEVHDAVNRRRLLVYRQQIDLSDQYAAATPVRCGLITSLREQIDDVILTPATGGLGGQPPSPTRMDWLWTSDETVITPQGFFEAMNGGTNWSDPALSSSMYIKALHLNELRWAIETLTQGRWEMPVYWPGGILSALPDTPWIGESISKTATGELRSVGYSNIYTDDDPRQGLQNVTVSADSKFYVTADTSCTVEIRYLDEYVDFAAGPTWNSTGQGTPIGTVTLAAGAEGYITGSSLAGALQTIVDGGYRNFLACRADTGYETVGITSRLVVQFDVNRPPN